MSCETPRVMTPRAENRIKLKTVYTDMRYRIMSRAFYGWLKHYKQAQTLRKHLFRLILHQETDVDEASSLNDAHLVEYIKENRPLDQKLWHSLLGDRIFNRNLFYKLVYLNGVENNELRRQVWPYLLNVFSFDMRSDEVKATTKELNVAYSQVIAEWQPIEAHVRERERDEKALSEGSITSLRSSPVDVDSGVSSDFTNTTSSSSLSSLATVSGFKTDRKKSLSTTTPIRSNLSVGRKCEKGKF